MKNKTYRNFLRVCKYLQDVKHYQQDEARSLAHLVFLNVEYDKQYGNRNAEYFMERILTAEEYYEQYK